MNRMDLNSCWNKEHTISKINFHETVWGSVTLTRQWMTLISYYEFILGVIMK